MAGILSESALAGTRAHPASRPVVRLRAGPVAGPGATISPRSPWPGARDGPDGQDGQDVVLQRLFPWQRLLLVIIGRCGYQTSTAFTAGNSLAAQSDAATLMFIFFGAGLARAWELPGLRGGGLLGLLATRGSRAGAGRCEG